MSVPLVVNGNTYLYPTNNQNSPWGEEATDWSVAVTGVLNSIQGPGDIILTTALITNNQISPANINGLTFSPASIRGAIVEYTVYRVTSGSGASEVSEIGHMYISYKNVANTWDVSVVGGNSSNVVFSINAGQVQYTSDNMTGTGYTGLIKFKATSFAQ